MSRIKTDPAFPQQVSVTSLIESYLFDLPDHEYLARRRNETWADPVLHDVGLQWGARHGSLLHKASEEGRLLWMQALIERGADPWQAAQSDGLPPVGWAAQAQQTVSVMELLRHPGRCPNPPDHSRTTLFHAMMAQTDPLAVAAWVRWWQAHGDPLCVALFDRSDTQGLYPTHVLANQAWANESFLDQLLELGFAADAQDQAGRTPHERLLAVHPELRPAPVVPVRAPGPRFRRRQVTS